MMDLACKQQKQMIKKKNILEEGRLIDSKRLREQSWDTDRNPGPQEARPHKVSNQNAAISASTVLLLLETTTGHHTGPMNCPRCSSFISGCTDVGGRVHCQVLGPLHLHLPGWGENESQILVSIVEGKLLYPKITLNKEGQMQGFW